MRRLLAAALAERPQHTTVGCGDLAHRPREFYGKMHFWYSNLHIKTIDPGRRSHRLPVSGEEPS